jgi:hypothetical protein
MRVPLLPEEQAVRARATSKTGIVIFFMSVRFTVKIYKRRN